MGAQEISDFRWKNRVLLLIDSEGNRSPEIDEQMDLFLQTADEMRERQLLMFTYDGQVAKDSDGTTKNFSLTAFFDDSFSGLILIGKDGGVKMKERFIVEPQRVFELIDSMPMRKAEMKSSKKY